MLSCHLDILKVYLFFLTSEKCCKLSAHILEHMTYIYHMNNPFVDSEYWTLSIKTKALFWVQPLSVSWLLWMKKKNDSILAFKLWNSLHWKILLVPNYMVFQHSMKTLLFQEVFVLAVLWVLILGFLRKIFSKIKKIYSFSFVSNGFSFIMFLKSHAWTHRTPWTPN